MKEHINALLGADIEYPGKGIGTAIERNKKIWVKQLPMLTTKKETESFCRGLTIRDPKAYEKIFENRIALLAILTGESA